MRATLLLLPLACALAAPLPLAIGGVVASHAPNFASFGWEMDVWKGSYVTSMNDTRYALAASALSPATIRLGGITGDWVRYTGFDGAEAVGEGAVQPGGEGVTPLGGYWPTAPSNLTLPDLSALLSFVSASNLTLMLMLNELYGRNCSTPVPGCPSCDPDWCVGEWDTSNVRSLLQFIHDNALFGGSSPLVSFELGNELVGHLPPATNVADIRALAAMLDEIWADVPDAARPSLYAPSTDACSSTAQLEIMGNITGIPRVKGFTFHAYPGESGQGSNALISLLLNATWLREGIMTGSDAVACLNAWTAGPRDAGLQLLVTESSSSWNLPLPEPAQNSFLNGFFTIAELGQYARSGVSFVARWAFSEPSPFGTLVFNKTANQWDAAADYWVIRIHKMVVGSAVLALTGDEGSDVLAYAYCGQAGNGSVVVAAVNPSLADVEVTFSLPAAPRLEYVLTAQGGNLSSTMPQLNGGAPLRLQPDGSLPPVQAAYVASGNVITVPARSQAYFVLLGAALPACGA